jgi:hypothetical protein
MCCDVSVTDVKDSHADDISAYLYKAGSSRN